MNYYINKEGNNYNIYWFNGNYFKFVAGPYYNLLEAKKALYQFRSRKHLKLVVDNTNVVDIKKKEEDKDGNSSK